MELFCIAVFGYIITDVHMVYSIQTNMFFTYLNNKRRETNGTGVSARSTSYFECASMCDLQVGCQSSNFGKSMGVCEFFEDIERNQTMLVADSDYAYLYQHIDTEATTVQVDACSTVVCENNRTCETNETGYTCSCVAGYRGRHCELACNGTLGLSCYIAVLEPKSWQEAREHCESLGAHLAAITSQEEEDAIRTAIMTISNWVWIGLFDAVEDVTVEWITGEAVTFNNLLHAGDGNPAEDDYDCGVLAYFPTFWSFMSSCSVALPSVCEYP